MIRSTVDLDELFGRPDEGVPVPPVEPVSTEAPVDEEAVTK